MNLEKLEKIARAATSPWKDSGSWYRDHRVGMPMHGSGENDECDATFIATFNPSTALSLIADLRKYVEALEAIARGDESAMHADFVLDSLSTKVCGWE